jgi:hypothetical protein
MSQSVTQLYERLLSILNSVEWVEGPHKLHLFSEPSVTEYLDFSISLGPSLKLIHHNLGFSSEHALLIINFLILAFFL